MQAANAATSFSTTDYVVVTSKVGTDADALCIIDMQTERLAVWKWDKTNNRLQAIGGRVLKTDFGRR